MTRDEAIAEIRRILGFRTDKKDEIAAAMRNHQERLEKSPELPWFLITEIATATTTADEERLELPSDFIREVEDGALWRYDADATEDADVWTELKKGFLDDLRLEYPGSGKPCAYHLDALYFRLFPTPDDAYTLKMRFYRKDTVLTSNIENKWLDHASDFLIGLVGEEFATAYRDQFALTRFTKMKAEGFARVLAENVAREAENFRYVMGGYD